MMRELHPEMLSGRYSQLIHNANVEAFLVHARNLIEFFKNKEPCDFDPRLFTKPGYEPNGNFIDSTLEAKINQQISHLTAERTAIAEEQLGPDEWAKIRGTIEAEIERFEKALRPEYEAKWTFNPQIVAVVQGALGPTNAISMTTSSSSSSVVDLTDGEIRIRIGSSDKL